MSFLHFNNLDIFVERHVVAVGRNNDERLLGKTEFVASYAVRQKHKKRRSLNIWIFIDILFDTGNFRSAARYKCAGFDQFRNIPPRENIVEGDVCRPREASNFYVVNLFCNIYYFGDEYFKSLVRYASRNVYAYGSDKLERLIWAIQ